MRRRAPRAEMRQARALIVLAIAGAFAGCVHVVRLDYPAEWPAAMVTPGTCPTVAATYENRDRGSRPVPLAHWALPKTTYPLDSISRIRLEAPSQGRLVVRLYLPNDDVATREWRLPVDHECPDGWLTIAGDSMVMPAPFVAGGVTLRIARTADGDLLVERSEAGGGVAVFVPLVSAHRDWHMYARLPD